MAAASNPPAYNSAFSNGNGPQLPPTFKIGSAFTPPLVSIQSVNEYQTVLSAFYHLKQHVLDAPWKDHLNPVPHPAARWALFLAKAKYRFELWVNRVVKGSARTRGETTSLADNEIPPLDVLLYLHAYHLNPMNLYEDGIRKIPELLATGGFPLSQAARLVNPQTGDYTPTHSQVEEWELRTQQPFSPALTTSESEGMTLTCPQCGCTDIGVPWLTPLTFDTAEGERLGHGFAQRGFSIQCASCETIIDREMLCANHLAGDIVRAAHLESEGKPGLFPNTLFNRYTSKESTALAQSFSKIVIEALAPPNVLSAANPRKAIAERFLWNITEAQTKIESAIKRAGDARTWHGEMIGRMMRAYRSCSPFSVELTGAVMRQDKFISRIHDLGWTPSSSSDSGSAAPGAIQTYHGFLDIAATKGSLKMLVPTLLIDLAWHTHQLSGERYRVETTKWVGRFLDHEDKVEEGLLATGFKDTSAAWTARYKTPYTTCGCIPPDSPSVTRAKSLKFWKNTSGTSSKRNDKDTIPPPSPDSTHPSEHNSINVIGGTAKPVIEGRKAREAQASKANQPGIHEMGFAAALPDGGADGFVALGAAGWDLYGVREASVINGNERAGDCCTGAEISLSTISMLSTSMPVWGGEGASGGAG